MKKNLLLLFILNILSFSAKSQTGDDEFGAWYQYFWNTNLGQSGFGFEGDVQYRHWEIFEDFQQFILRGAATYNLDSQVKFAVGYGHFTSGAFGESRETSVENRIFEDVGFPHKIGNRVYLNHRLRFEQRWIKDLDLQTRLRYLLALNLPLNDKIITANTFYLSLANEVFINPKRKMGDNRKVEYFDRNWLRGSLGYAFQDNLKVQLGVLHQSTGSAEKNNLVLSLLHSF